MQLFEHLNIPERFASNSFSDFIVHDKNKEAFDSLSLFCDSFCNDKSFRKSYRSFFIFGPSRRGKTHLSAAALHLIYDFFCKANDNYLKDKEFLHDQEHSLSIKLRKGEIQQEQFEKAHFDFQYFIANSNCPNVDLLFLNTRVFCDQLRESWRKKQGKHLTENASKVGLLVIDDLGNEQIDPLHKGYIQEIIQIVLNRYDSNKPIIINSQCNLHELGNRYEKLFPLTLVDSFLSRISDNLVGVQIGGDGFKSK